MTKLIVAFAILRTRLKTAQCLMYLQQSSSGSVDSFVTGFMTLEANTVNDPGAF